MPYFNPRPREGSDVFLQSVVVVLQISIHAPVKGATLPIIANFLSCFDFNPRPREGSDNQQDWLKPEMPYFNPRPREGSDVFLQSVVVVLQISIHAPVKGATAPISAAFFSTTISIHAPVKGATALNATKAELAGVFQSTLP